MLINEIAKATPMKLTTDFVALGLSKTISIPLLFLETILLGRILGPAGFGEWTLLLAAATILYTALIN